MVITVQCPSCASTFPVDSSKIPEKGVRVRCSSCSEIFRVERPVEAPSVPPPAAPEPVLDEPPAFQSPEPEPEPGPEPEPAAFDSTGFEGFETAPDTWKDRSPEAETDFSFGATEAEAEPAGAEEEWVFETEPDIDAGGLEIEAMETVESTVEEAREEAGFFGATSGFETAEVELQPEAAPEPEPSAPEPTIMPPPEPEPAAPVGGFTFGKRDPKEKARRLARVLVSDMIMYNPDRHARALANGTLKEDFEEEIQKSWKEYVEQVGEEMATSNDFWSEALNDVLAKGQRVF